MKYLSVLIVPGLVFVTGCRVAHDVAVSSFRVIDAPAHYVRRHLDESDSSTTTTTTTTTAESDVATPGRPVTQVTKPAPTPPRRTSAQTAARSSTPRPSTTTSADRPRSSPAPARTASSQEQFPTARPVPGKPGYVYSLDPNGGYVDVSGYKSGSKAKDPYTQKIFIVP